MSKLFAALAAVVLLTSCRTVESKNTKHNMVATWYMHGTRTANGEKFNPDGMTVAHKTIPFNTMLRLTYKDKSVIVRVNDRGPFIKGRDIDLSRGVAKVLDCGGVCTVEVEFIQDERK